MYLYLNTEVVWYVDSLNVMFMESDLYMYMWNYRVVTYWEIVSRDSNVFGFL